MVNYQALKATIRVGKQGITQTVVDEILHQLEQHGLVKIKMLSSIAYGADKKALARELAQKTGSKLVYQVGGVLVLRDESRPIKPFKKS